MMFLASQLGRRGMICSSVRWTTFASTSDAIHPLTMTAATRCAWNHPWNHPRAPMPSPRGCGSSTGTTRLYSTMANTVDATLDWDDRVGLQDRFTPKEKGWRVAVEWRSTPYGAGVFANEDIVDGTILRCGVLGVNLKKFSSIADIEDYCQSGETDDAGRRAKMNYVKDYLWGFNKDADAMGYDKAGVLPPDSDRFFGMWIPGNGLNHNETPNMVYKTSADGIDLVALGDIRAGDELYDDYRRHGLSSPWLKEFSSIYNVTLNFADCNDFV